MIDEKKYPRATAFLKQHPGMTVDEAIKFLENSS